jgi:threonine aldolase
MHFKSDNTANVSQQILGAIYEGNDGYSSSYGKDEYSTKLKVQLEQIFEHSLDFYLTSTGTAANALALSAIAPNYGAIYCHEEAHINTDESGAAEFFSGAKLCAIQGEHGKINLDLLAKQIKYHLGIKPHASKPAAISISQSNEIGAVYSLAEIKALKKIASDYSLAIHMDGARFANALVALDVTPAAMTWQSGVDILSFGATKNGALAAEMVIIFNKKYAEDFAYRHKRAGQLMSKTRFFAAQFLAYFAHDLWLHNARQANAMARLLDKELRKFPHIEISHQPQANEVFVKMSSNLADYLLDNGVGFYPWHDGQLRFVTTFTSNERDIQQLVALLKAWKKWKSL